MAHSVKFQPHEVDAMVIFAGKSITFRTTKAVKTEKNEDGSSKTASTECDQGYSVMIRDKVMLKYKVRLSVKDVNVGSSTTTVYAKCECQIKARINLTCPTAQIQKSQALTFMLSRPAKGSTCDCRKIEIFSQ